MRYAIFGDIHGNLHALEAVLAAYEEESIDRYICTGDLVGYGAFPQECIAVTRKHCEEVVAGNHDFAVCGKLTLEFFNSYAKSAVLWTRDALDDEHHEYLRALPLVIELDKNVTLSHATIYDAHVFDYIQTQYDAHLSLQELKTTCGFVGHSHIPIVFYLKNGIVSWTMECEIDVSDKEKVLVNVGSVGQPRDENPHAAYAVYDTDEERIWIKRIPYDVEAAITAIEKEGLPRILGERLRLGK
ncbi:MAG: metallophosphatase family protein [Planctomycetota bacterium]|nr:metallophosphatase family protein [Planctomycetota bacterium]